MKLKGRKMNKFLKQVAKSIDLELEVKENTTDNLTEVPNN
jgi:hypothetical protein